MLGLGHRLQGCHPEPLALLAGCWVILRTVEERCAGAVCVCRCPLLRSVGRTAAFQIFDLHINSNAVVTYDLSLSALPSFVLCAAAACWPLSSVLLHSTYNAVAQDFPLSARQVLQNLQQRAQEVGPELGVWPSNLRVPGLKPIAESMGPAVETGGGS